MKLTSLFFLAFLLRATYIIAASPLMPSDSGSFDIVAWNLVTHGIYAGEDLQPTARRPPTYPLLIAAIYKLTGHHLRAVQMVQAALGAGSVILLVFLARRLTPDPWVPWISGMAAAIYPFLIYYDALMLAEPFIIFFLLLSLLTFMTWRQTQNAWGLAALAGLSFSLLSLTKTIFIPLFIVIVLLEGLWVARRPDQAKRWGALVLMSGVFMMPILAWGLRNQRHFGAFVLDTHGGLTTVETVVYYEECKKGTFQEYFWAHPEIHAPANFNEVEKDRFYAAMTRDFIRTHRRQYARQIFGNVKNFWRFYPRQDLDYKEGRQRITWVSLLTEPFLIITGWIGLIQSRRRWADLYPIYLVIGLLSTVHALVTAQMRYRLPLMPYFILFSAMWVVSVLQRRRDGVS